MPAVLFNSNVFNEARDKLRTASRVDDAASELPQPEWTSAKLRVAIHVRDAAVDIGGYLFERGARDFSTWSIMVKAELSLELAATKLAELDLDLADVYVRMLGRAFKLVKETANTRNADPGAAAESLKAFLEISKPPVQFSQAPTATTNLPTETSTRPSEPRSDDRAISPGAATPTQLLPDLGMHLAGKGWPQKSMFIYTSWEIDDLAVVGRGRYCTTRVQPMDGNLYCATFDFGDDILQQILARAPAATRAMVSRSLAEDPDSVRHLPMPNPINLGIAATLGNLQQGLHEAFNPLVITEVFGADPTATMEGVGIDPSGKNLSETEPEETVPCNDGIKRSADSEQIGHSTLPTPEITMSDVKAIRVYCRHVAREWWRTHTSEVAICDACNGPVSRDEGFLLDDLCCEGCFGPASTPDEALDNLRDDADYYGEGLLDQARRFAGMRPLK